MIRKLVLDSIVVLANGDVPKVMKEDLLNSLIDIEPLKDTTIIQVENVQNGGYAQNFKGIDMAHEILTKDPHRHIILYSPCPLEFLRKRKEKLDILLAKPNVRLLEAPFSIATMVSAFESSALAVDSKDTAKALTDHVRGALSGIFHDIRKAKDPLNPEGEWQIKIVAAGFKHAKETFPMLADKDNTTILKFLEEISANREEVRKGERLTGTFCDMEGTLFANGVLQNATLETLKKHEAEGKEITLWTDGNIAELQSLLDANGITYKLHAKRDYAGAIVETAIDDMDENSFTALTKIYAEKFIRVQDLAS